MMKRYVKASLFGAAVALGLTLLILAPLWFSQANTLWGKAEALPDQVTSVLGWIIGIFAFAGIHIAEFFHKRHEHLGCRTLHLDWVVQWSLCVNAFVGAMVGAIVVKTRERLARTKQCTLSAGAAEA